MRRKCGRFLRSPRRQFFSASPLWAFLTGTAAEVTPIREVDARIIGPGKPGPITQKLQAAFFDIVKGKNPQYQEWLTYI